MFNLYISLKDSLINQANVPSLNNEKKYTKTGMKHLEFLLKSV